MPEDITVTRPNGATFKIEVLDATTGLIRRTRLAAGTTDQATSFRPQSLEEHHDDYVTDVPSDTDPADYMYAWLLRRRFNNPSSIAVSGILSAQFPGVSAQDLEAAAALFAAKSI